MEPARKKKRYFRLIVLTFGILMVLEFSLNIFGLASFNVNSSLWRHLNLGRRYIGNISDVFANITVKSDDEEIVTSPLSPLLSQQSTRKPDAIVTSPKLNKLNAKRSTLNYVISLSSSGSTTTTPSSFQSSPTSALCPDPPPKLVGLLHVDKKPKELPAVEKLHASDMSAGGFFKPDCVARHRVAIIIPFRDREQHLHIFLHHILPILKRQLLEFQIYVVDLVPGVRFNRAMLMNIGFAESIKEHDWQCFVFHDVDLLPENDRNIYSCPEKPRHMSAAVDTMHYRLPYATIFGGVSAMTRSQFETINGFSNRFFGWGGEDDDVYNRIHAKEFQIIRYPMSIARYSMISHKKDSPNPARYDLLKTGVKRMPWDGVNSLKYKVIKVLRTKLFTRIIVSFNEAEVMKARGPKR